MVIVGKMGECAIDRVRTGNFQPRWLEARPPHRSSARNYVTISLALKRSVSWYLHTGWCNVGAGAPIALSLWLASMKWRSSLPKFRPVIVSQWHTHCHRFVGPGIWQCQNNQIRHPVRLTIKQAASCNSRFAKCPKNKIHHWYILWDNDFHSSIVGSIPGVILHALRLMTYEKPPSNAIILWANTPSLYKNVLEQHWIFSFVKPTRGI